MTQRPSDGSATADYLRVLRENKRVVALVTLVCCAAAIVASLLQEPTYEAKASLAYRDVSQDLGIVGVPVAPLQTPTELAAGGAQTATDPDVARTVKRELRSGRSVRSLADSVDASVEGASNFVSITASADSADEAARLANAFAAAAAGVATERVRRRFRVAADGVRRKIRATDSKSLVRLGLQERLSNLETLASVAEPARTVKRAETPTSPASPKTAFNAVLGLVIGFIFGMFAAFMRSRADRRLKETEEAERELGLPMIGKLRSEALGRSPRAADGREPLEPPDLEALRILRRNVEFLSPDNRISLLAVTSPLPEEGKSTVAVALAFMAAAAGRRTLLVETDLRRPVFAQRLGVPATPGITDFLAGEASLDDALHEVPLLDDDQDSGSGAVIDAGTAAELFCLTAGSPVTRSDELLGSQRFRDFLSTAREDFDFVVLDTAPLLPVADTLELVPAVDGLLLCVRIEQTTREQAVAAKTTLARLPARPTGIVVTGVSPGTDSYGSYAYSHAYERRSPESGAPASG